MNIEIGKKAIVTTDNWFYAPDGKQYRGVFGTVKGVFTAEETLGVKSNAKSTNWYVEIGNITIAGCQIHYAVRSDHCNTTGTVRDWSTAGDKGLLEYDRPSAIYNAG